MNSQSVEWLVARAQEPSTWVSLGTMLTGLGFAVAPEYWQSISAVCMSLGGLAGVLLRERKKTTTADIVTVVEDTVKPSAMQPQK